MKMEGAAESAIQGKKQVDLVPADADVRPKIAPRQIAPPQVAPPQVAPPQVAPLDTPEISRTASSDMAPKPLTAPMSKESVLSRPLPKIPSRPLPSPPKASPVRPASASPARPATGAMAGVSGNQSMTLICQNSSGQCVYSFGPVRVLSLGPSN